MSESPLPAPPPPLSACIERFGSEHASAIDRLLRECEPGGAGDGEDEGRLGGSGDEDEEEGWEEGEPPPIATPQLQEAPVPSR
jgi:hypothetical protein